MDGIAMADTSRLTKLAEEYRPTMDGEVLHAWAQDVRKAIGPRVGDVYTVDTNSLHPLAGQTVTVMETDGHLARVLPGKVALDAVHQRHLMREDGSLPWA